MASTTWTAADEAEALRAAREWRAKLERATKTKDVCRLLMDAPMHFDNVMSVAMGACQKLLSGDLPDKHSRPRGLNDLGPQLTAAVREETRRYLREQSQATFSADLLEEVEG